MDELTKQVDGFHEVLTSIIPTEDNNLAEMIAATIAPSVISFVGILIATISRGNKGETCDTQMVEAQQLVKTLYDLLVTASKK